MNGQELAIMDIKGLLENAVDLATSLGLVVTVEQVPLQPPAMGNHKTVVTVRPKYQAS